MSGRGTVCTMSSPTCTPTARWLEAYEAEEVVTALLSDIDDVARWQVAATRPFRTTVAEASGRPIGLALGVIGHASYTVVEMCAGPCSVEQAVEALLRHLRTQFPGLSIEVRIPDDPVGNTVEAALSRLGLQLLRDEICYGRSLPAEVLGAGDDFLLRHYDEVGKARVVDVMALVIRDDPYFSRRGMDALDALDEMIDDCTIDGRLNSSLWYLVEVDGVSAGVVLGRYDPENGEGSLAYMGLTPSFRGRGLGRAIHRSALGVLTDAGVVEYRDATARDNVAMLRVFEHNGCTPRESARIWRLDTEPMPSTFESLGALTDWLEADGRIIETFGPNWIQLEWRCGYHSRSLEIGWIADARVTQVVQTFDLTVPGGVVPELTRAIAAINASLNVPGIFLDESTHTAGFRMAILQDGDGSIDARQLVTCCQLAVNTAHAYYDQIARRCRPARQGISLQRTNFAPPQDGPSQSGTIAPRPSGP